MSNAFNAVAIDSKHFILHCPLYNNHRHILLNQLATQNIDIAQARTAHFLDIITRGTTLNAERGRAVAGAVQNFIVAALAARGRAVSGEDGGNT